MVATIIDYAKLPLKYNKKLIMEKWSEITKKI